MKKSEFKIRKTLRKDGFDERAIREIAKSPFGVLYDDLKRNYEKYYGFSYKKEEH